MAVTEFVVIIHYRIGWYWQGGGVYVSPPPYRVPELT
jgi:hypothetical protein